MRNNKSKLPSIKRVAGAGKTNITLVSHNRLTVTALCDLILIMFYQEAMGSPPYCSTTGQYGVWSSPESHDPCAGWILLCYGSTAACVQNAE